ncbi:MAG: quinolinate synthase NadA, partial [Bacteroidaceae bacterium]|nr:quinolinate synthase NadA [Bacteroidaceae bacterium]
KAAHPEALVLVHPESIPEVVELSDYAGSTSGIIDFATKSEAKEFIIVTELGVMYELKTKNPDKKFYAADENQICHDMKKVTLEKVRDCLKNGLGAVEVEEDLREKSLIPLERMLELAK